MDEHGNPLERDHSLYVVLPGGLEKKALIHGSKPVMDLLVTLCASYHLNPSDYTVEVLSPNKNNISFKPNSPIGSLEAEKIVLKPKGLEENIRAPYMPEATVRLLINYNKSHKAVVRVNPRVPLEMLLPAVCDKCELRVETTVLLRDCQSTEPLDMNKTLNDHGLREVFARDTAVAEPGYHQQHHNTSEAVTPPESISTPLQDMPKKKKQENTGFLSLFRRKKKKDELERAASAPASPDPNKQVSVNANAQALSSCTSITGDMPKKRRAPQPPMGVSQSVPNNLSTCHLTGAQRSAESTLQSTKRRAPPPPCANTQRELQEDARVQETLDSLKTLEELRESDESDSVSQSASSSSSPSLLKLQSSSCSSRQSLAHLDHVAESYWPSFRGKDIPDARCTLANILTSSISKGLLFKHLRNSATLPKVHNGSLLMSLTQQCPDNGVCAELESVLNSKLPTEPEWEDPAQKKGMTTFKVVPSKKHNSQDPDLNLDAPDQCQEKAGDNDDEASSDTKNIQTETDEDSDSHTSENGTALTLQVCSTQDIQAFETSDIPPPPLVSDDQECPASAFLEFWDAEEKLKKEDNGEVPSEGTPAALEEPLSGVKIHSKGQSKVPLSPSKDIEHSSLYADDKEVEEGAVQEEEEEGEETHFPPPPPPIFFNEDLDLVKGEREEDDAAADAAATMTSSSQSCSQPTSPGCNGQSNGFSDDHSDKSRLAISAAAPMSPEKTSAAPSRFAQAVALAVQRSRFQSQGIALGAQSPHGPHGTLPSTHRSTYQYGA